MVWPRLAYEKETPSVFLHLILFVRKVKLLHSQKVPEGSHLLGWLKTMSQLAFRLGLALAKIYSTGLLFLPCSRGHEIHLRTINTHSSGTMWQGFFNPRAISFPGVGMRSILRLAYSLPLPLSVTWMIACPLCTQIFSPIT